MGERPVRTCDICGTRENPETFLKALHEVPEQPFPQVHREVLFCRNQTCAEKAIMGSRDVPVVTERQRQRAELTEMAVRHLEHHDAAQVTIPSIPTEPPQARWWQRLLGIKPQRDFMQLGSQGQPETVRAPWWRRPAREARR